MKLPMINLAYFLLLLTVFSAVANPKKWLTISLIIFAVAWGLLQQVINFYGLASILVFYGLTYGYFNGKFKKPINYLFLALILLLTVGFSLHIVPGFNNAQPIIKTAVSPSSVPFSMYLNFDKVMAAIILLVNGNFYHAPLKIDLKSLKVSGLILLLMAGFFITLGELSGYIKFDFKVPSILGIWLINNLCFVSFSQEVIFRGFLQQQLRSGLSDTNFWYLAVIMASIAFGLDHSSGGAVYVLFATVAGLFYGVCFEKTGNIIYAIMVHFGFNLIHLIFFAYPAARDLALIWRT